MSRPLPVLDVLTRPHLTVGRVAGVPVSLNISWFPIFVLVAWSLGTGFLPQAVPGGAPLPTWFAALAGTMLFFVSILAHEFGHALVAMRCGIPVSSVTLFILGGVSRIAEEPRNAREELLIAAAGPAVSFLTAIVFLVAGAFTGSGSIAGAVAFYLVLVNAALAVFNLLPALPLDGGRMLRAALWAMTGNVHAATGWAAWGGRACGIAFMLVGGLSLAFGAIVPAGWMLLLGLFIERSAKGSVEVDPPLVGLRPPGGLPGDSLASGSLVDPARVPLDVHVLHSGPEAVLMDERFRKLEGKVIAWRARLDVLPLPGDIDADGADTDDGPLARRYADDRMRMYQLLQEIDEGIRRTLPDAEIDSRFERLSRLHSAWAPGSFAGRGLPDAGEDAMLAGRPERYAPDPEEVLAREPGSSIEV